MTVEDTSRADIAPISTASTPEQLEEIMAVARAGAEAQAAIEAEGGDPFAVADSTDEGEDLDEGEGEGEGEGAEEPTEEQPASEPRPKPRQQPKVDQEQERFSRRDASRFKADLDTAQAELQQARSELQARQASDTSIIQAIREQAGDEREYQALLDKLASGRATPEEQQRTNIMRSWRISAGPIYRVAQQQMVAAWGTALQDAVKLEGMDEKAHRQLMSTPDPTAVRDIIHQAGFRAGEKKAQAEIQRLKAEVSSLKTKVVVSKPQPATPDGTSPAAGPKLPPMLLATGELNPEFEKLAHSGKLYGVEHLQ